MEGWDWKKRQISCCKFFVLCNIREKQPFTCQQLFQQATEDSECRSDCCGRGVGGGDPSPQGEKPTMFVLANQRPNSVWSKMTNMTFDSRDISKASKTERLSGIVRAYQHKSVNMAHSSRQGFLHVLS